MTTYEARANQDDPTSAATLGPQWREIVALAKRVASLTPHEIERLGAARDATGDAAWAAARAAAWVSARGASRAAAWAASRGAAGGAAWGTAWDAARDASWGAARDTVWEAAGALCARDLIGQHGFTQDHYNVLTLPWAAVIGPVHPDDVERDGRYLISDIRATG